MDIQKYIPIEILNIIISYVGDINKLVVYIDLFDKTDFKDGILPSLN